MRLKTNCDLISLYFKHITQEIFTETFAGEHKDDIFEIEIDTTDTHIISKAFFLSYQEIVLENINLHSSISTARSCAVGRCIVGIANKLGFSTPPYGVLTGVRPLKIAKDLYRSFGEENLCDKLNDVYLVDRNKGNLLKSCLKYDFLVSNKSDNKDVSIYISIPFCPSRCNYCSFVSSSIENKQSLIPRYLEVLFEEMILVSKIIEKSDLKVKSIYVGGGTPGILNAEQTTRLLEQITQMFVSDNCEELCFELGRPDTVTLKKLEVLKRYNVDRICINTQTTNDEILTKIGRRHTAKQYFAAVETAKNFGFSSINTDIIAGLPDESFDSFRNTVDGIINIGVDNITVHTLCIKKSAEIKKDSLNFLKLESINDFLEYSKNACISSGYEPYYLYRQKYALGNHESVGYCKNKKYSYYNIAMMNEIQTVLGIGAGATSRVISNSIGLKHSHFENYKYPYDYLRDKSKMLSQISEIKNVLEN